MVRSRVGALFLLISLVLCSRIYPDERIETVNLPFVRTPIHCASTQYDLPAGFPSTEQPSSGLKWKPVTFPDTHEGAGYTWYQCEYDLTDKPGNIVVVIEGARHADETFVNGRLVGRTGRMVDQFPEWKNIRAYPVPNAVLKPGPNTLSVKLRSGEWTTAMAKAPEFRDGSELSGILRAASRATYMEMVLGAVFLFVGLYFYYLWWHFRSALDNLFFAVYCTDLAVYLWVRSAVPYFFGYNWFTLCVEYSSLFLTAPIFCRFLYAFLKAPSPRGLYVYEVATAAVVVYIAAVHNMEHWWRLLGVFRFTLLGTVVWTAWLIVRAVLRGHAEARYLAFTFGIFAATVVADIFSSIRVLKTPPLVPFGFIFFLLGIAFILANRYVDLFREQKNRSALLRDLDRRKTEFLSNISHELKTPLSVIMLCAEAIAEKFIGGPDAVERAMTDVEANAARLQQIVSDAVLLNKIETGHFVPDIQSCALGEMVGGAVRELQGRAEKRGIVVDARVPQDLSIKSDPVLLSRIVDHVIENAVLYNVDGGRVTVEAKSTPGLVEVVVSDQGTGLPPDVKSRLFQKFVRGDMSSTYSVPGTGTGLALAAAAARLIGGSLRLIRSGPAGSIFSLQFAQPEAVRA